jgi:hypothetical protein
MELRIQLKICEGCGCLWFRALGQVNVYCHRCETKLQDHPDPLSRKRPGRARRNPLPEIWAVAQAIGGAE